jgi:transposase
MRDGCSVAEVAQKFGVSRQSLYRWMTRYEEGGLEALADRSHRPHDVPHQMSAAIEIRVLEMRRQHPLWGPLRIVHQLSAQGVDPPPLHMAVYRALLRHGLITPGAKRKKLPTYKRWERGRAMGSGKWTWSAEFSWSTPPGARSPPTSTTTRAS